MVQVQESGNEEKSRKQKKKGFISVNVFTHGSGDANLAYFFIMKTEDENKVCLYNDAIAGIATL